MTWWTEQTQSRAGLRFLDRILRGCAQVMFQDHPLTGFLFLLGLVIAALTTGHSEIALAALWGLIVSTLMAYWLRVDKGGLDSGLFGFNGVLTGAAVATFLGENSYVWLLLTVGAAASTVVFMALANFFKVWEAPALTFPFVLVTWTLLMAIYSFSKIPVGSLSHPVIPTQVPPSTAALTPLFLFESVFNGISQVFLIQNPFVGLLFVIALAVSSRWAAALAVLGSALAAVVAWGFGADAPTVQGGLFGFSPVLTAIALGCTFYQPARRVLLFTLLGVVSTVFAQAAMDVLVEPLGVPTLTAPFVFTTWVFLLAKGDLDPVPHSELQQKTFGTQA